MLRARATRPLPILFILVAALSLVAIVSAQPPSSESRSSGEMQRTARRGPRQLFEDRSRAAGLPRSETPTWGSTWTDYDRDGDPDLVIVRHKRRALLYRNEDGHYSFSALSETFRPPAGRWYFDRHGCAWGEANGDEDPDLVCVSGAQKGKGTGPNQLMLGPELVQRGADFGIEDVHGRGRSVNWLDHDGDGDLDLFVGNLLRPGHPSRFFRNDGARFAEVDIGVTEERGTTSSATADWDGDGDPDLLVLGNGYIGSAAFENVGGRFTPARMAEVTGMPWHGATFGDFDADGWTDLLLVGDERAVVLRNRSGTMRPTRTFALEAGRMGVWFDLENDGDLDVFLVQGRADDAAKPVNAPDLLYVNEGGRFRSVESGAEGSSSGDGDAVSVADSDRDGHLDLFVTNGFGDSHRGAPAFFRNLTDAGNWIGLELLGGPRNPLGFGARVKVRAGRRTMWTEQTDAVAYRTQSDAGYVHLGIGKARLARVVVMWADGTRDCLTTPAAASLPVDKGSFPCGPGTPLPARQR